MTTSKAQSAAVKAHKYIRERDVYHRLAEHGVRSIAGFTVPTLFNHHDTLWILEMGIVSPPFVVDFAGAYLDRKPPFTAEEMSEIVEVWEERFEDRWPQVQRLLAGFRRYGIYLNDVKYGNIMFAD